MEVSMNGLRKNLIADYNLLVKRLNNSIKYDKNGYINLPPNEIEKQMNGLMLLILQHKKLSVKFHNLLI